MFIAAMPMKGEEKLYDNVIRLHIIANSDTRDDQDLKLLLRDVILTEYSAKLTDAQTKEIAENQILSLIGEIKITAEKVMAEHGHSYPIDIKIGTEYYPEREYDELHLPAGNYTSLRIIIGEGAGKNWWCVLFPPLCISTAYGDKVTVDDSIPVGLTPDQYKLITKSDDVKYIVKFKVLEILEEIFEK